jgi:creatinine amidohydrolase
MSELPEVRYHMLRPEQVLARRRECPVAYIPIGTIEWHGFHNPLGADSLQAEGQAIACARLGGGLVFPTLYYGENRLQGLMEANAADRQQIAESMELPPENFTPEYFPFDAVEQAENYQRLLVHILAQLNTLGFRVGVIVAGHYPLIDHARSAVLRWQQSEIMRRKDGMLAWAFVDYLLVKDQFPQAGDHAGGWETSRTMALHPQSVDLNVLPETGQKLVGAGGHIPPQEATPEFGRKTLDVAAEVAVAEVKHRLANRHMYMRHGYCLSEGLWRSEEV